MDHELSDDPRLARLYAARVAARGVPDGTPCVAPEAMLALVRREGPEEARLATLDHVMSCAPCHREYEWLSAVDQAATETEAGATGPRRARWRSPPLALAASLAAGVTAAILVRQAIRDGAEPVRGADGAIELVEPAGGAAAAAPLSFVWHPVPDASRYVLEIQRGDQLVFADTTADTSFTLADPASLPPAADYRWWVREVTDGAEPRSSALRDLRIKPR